MIRQSSALTSCLNVWADVASSKSIGFHEVNGAPRLYGDTRGGGELEIVIMENKEGEYRTVALATRTATKEGQVFVATKSGAHKVLAVVTKAPKGLREELVERFFVRASSEECARDVLDDRVQSLLIDLADRAPELTWKNGRTVIVLEGIELVHERMERLVTALSEIGAPPVEAPYREQA